MPDLPFFSYCRNIEESLGAFPHYLSASQQQTVSSGTPPSTNPDLLLGPSSVLTWQTKGGPVVCPEIGLEVGSRGRFPTLVPAQRLFSLESVVPSVTSSSPPPGATRKPPPDILFTSSCNLFMGDTPHGDGKEPCYGMCAMGCVP